MKTMTDKGKVWKTKGRSLGILNVIKGSTVVTKKAMLCLMHALVIATATPDNEPHYV
jgi:hypothetical protein